MKIESGIPRAACRYNRRMAALLTVTMYCGIPAILLFGVQFLSLRIRDTRAEPRDPQLGRKSLLYLFFNLAIFLVMFGLTASSLDVYEYLLVESMGPANAFSVTPIQPQVLPPDGEPAPIMTQPIPAPIVTVPVHDWFNSQQRMAAALVTTGLFYLLIFAGAIRFFTNDRDFPAVRQTFAASRLGMGILILMSCTAAILIAVFQEGETDKKIISQTAAAATVWGPFTILHLVLVLRGGRETE